MTPRRHARAADLFTVLAGVALLAGLVFNDISYAIVFGCLIMAHLHSLHARVQQIAEALDGKAISTSRFTPHTSYAAHQDTHDFYNDTDA